MGKHNPVNTVEKCGEWLCTRTKKKMITPPVTGKRACLSRPLKSIGNLIKSSPPPEELKTHTKQSKLVKFFGKKLPDTLNNETGNVVELSESSEELPTLSSVRKIDINNTFIEKMCSFHIGKKGDNFTLNSPESEEDFVDEKGSHFCKEGELPPLKSPYYNKRKRSSDTCLPYKHPKYESEMSFVNKNQLKDTNTSQESSQSDSSSLEQFSCNSKHCDDNGQNQNNCFYDFQLRNPTRKNNISESSSYEDRNEKHNLGGNVLLENRRLKHFDKVHVVTQTSDTKSRTCDILNNELLFMSEGKSPMKRSGIQTCDHVLSNDLDLVSEVKPPIKPPRLSRHLSDIPNTELDLLSEVHPLIGQQSVSQHTSDIPNTELDFLSEVHPPMGQPIVSQHLSDIPNTELDLLSEVQHCRELPVSSNDLNSDLMSDIDSPIKKSATLEKIKYAWNMGSCKDQERKLINTQEADQELENFSLDNDSQISL
ncbi:unnamed protein product [Mytilus coruscus]|uniref:Uncharacterized protein n=1 Tax=Mytilus coruscus TaxID=42192 RepID=A0A6J8CT12_MYTCO|nr:unnamed protein product [Mytilus coruscus]